MQENKNLPVGDSGNPRQQPPEKNPPVLPAPNPLDINPGIQAHDGIVPEQAQGQNLSSTQIKTATAAITTQQTENMEVHHHGHVHEKKKWKEYVFQFLMLFLAVFCGFLAEYQLEHKIERDREKKFIQTFIEDLKIDTAAIRQNILFRQNKMRAMDTVMLLLNTQQVRGHESDLYYFGRSFVRGVRFQSNDRTITQLKNSGSLRLIRNEKAADSMMAYQKLVEYIYYNQEDDRMERRAADPLLSRMYNPFVFDKMVSIDGIGRSVENPALRSYDPNIHYDLAYYVHQLKGSNFMIEVRLKLLNEKAKNMMIFLKQEYHLE